MQAYGDSGYEARLDHAMQMAQYLEGKILGDGDAFVLVHPRSFTNVCFYWIPPSLRPLNLNTASKSELDELGKVRRTDITHRFYWCFRSCFVVFTVSDLY